MKRVRNIIVVCLLFYISIISFSSCQKEKKLAGKTFVEISPFKGHTKIHFIDDAYLTIMYGTDTSEYKYGIHRKKIKLTNINYEETVELYFHLINENKFEMWTLHAYIPYPPGEDPPMMIFEKE